MTPKQYLLARKLDASCRAMTQRGGNTTVSDVASEFGLSSARQFAEHYRRQLSKLSPFLLAITEYQLRKY